MDEIDIKLLTALEENARISLKSLAGDLDVKTSTIYHRLHKLREANILQKYTIIINPEELGLSYFVLLSMKLKTTVIGKLDTMFLESFCKYMSEEFDEIIFNSVGDDDKIWAIGTFRDAEHFEEFKAKLLKNEYIDNLNHIKFSKFNKGKKIFNFKKKLIKNIQEDAVLFDDSSQDFEKNENGSVKRNKTKRGNSMDTSEVFF